MARRGRGGKVLVSIIRCRLVLGLGLGLHRLLDVFRVLEFLLVLDILEDLLTLPLNSLGWMLERMLVDVLDHLRTLPLNSIGWMVERVLLEVLRFLDDGDLLTLRRTRKGANGHSLFPAVLAMWVGHVHDMDDPCTWGSRRHLGGVF
jgi:hypothetical protein